MKLTSRLSRSAIDATRFTATSPHAYSKPTSLRSAPVSSSTVVAASRTTPQARTRFVNPNAPKRPPEGPSSQQKTETPAEKVARLRAARIAEREAQVSQWDKVVVRGRSWADRAHKFTVYFLVTFSVAAAAITAFALTDMILHNRRKRSAFYAEQRALYSTRLLDAIETEKAGLPLDEDQTLILNRERARVQAEEAKKERGGIKGWLFGGLKEEEGVKEEAVVVPSEQEILERIGVNGMKVLERAEGKAVDVDAGRVGERETKTMGEGGLLQAIENKRRTGEKALETQGVTGGPFDKMAENAVEKAKSKSSWLGWGR